MKKKASRRLTTHDRDTMRAEYDFTKGVRGLTHLGITAGTKIVLIDPEVLDVFPDGNRVNEALRALAPVLRAQRNRRSG